MTIKNNNRDILTSIVIKSNTSSRLFIMEQHQNEQQRQNLQQSEREEERVLSIQSHVVSGCT